MNAKNEVRKICVKRWKRWEMRENPKALDAAGKAARAVQRKAAIETKKEAEVALKALPRPEKLLDELADAAQFVTDVNGDNPSIPQLGEVLARVRQWQAAKEQFDGAVAAFRKLDTGAGYHSRCEVCSISVIPGLGGIATQEAAGDTWTEVLQKLQPRVAVAAG